MTTSLQHPGSWWADPSVQRDRDAFRVAVRQQEIRWLEEDKRIRQVMAGLATIGWMTEGGKRRGMAGFSVVTP